MRKIEGDLKVFVGIAYILILSRDKKSWWAERLIGFLKVCEENITYWTPAYIEDSFVSPVSEKQTSTVIYDRKPTKYDAKQLSESSVIEFIGGELKESMGVVIWD